MVGHEYLVNANGLVIITSAMFAIAQYTDTTHRDSIRKKVGSIDSFLSTKEHLNKSEDLKKLYDNIKNHTRLRASHHIIYLFVMLLAFGVMETSIMLCPNHAWEKYVFAGMGILLVCIGFWLGVQMLRMGKERSTLNKDIVSFKQMCDIATQTSSTS